MSLGNVDGLKKMPIHHNGWTFSDDDLALYAMLNDPVYMPELLWKDPKNFKMSGCYRVRDYQYRINRVNAKLRDAVKTVVNAAIIACSRAIGKTESEKVHAQIHGMWAMEEHMLITAPQLIHLLPLTDQIEDNIEASTISMELLDTRRAGKTGFTHRPFGIDYLNGTKIFGRIPNLDGRGVKGMHEVFLMVEEGQDYPEKGWKEVQETVNFDAVDRDGNPAWRFWIYGVHSGDPRSGFAQKARSDGFTTIQATRMMRHDWGRHQKEIAKSAYGSTSDSDYRRNIYGEPGSAVSAYFHSARLMACVDQDRESKFNTEEYVVQEFSWEEFSELGMNVEDALDLPSGYNAVYAGTDLGLTNSPTCILLFAEVMVGKVKRLKLIRRFMLERFKSKQIRAVFYAIDLHFGDALKSFGMDVTGLGFPIFQELEDDEICPPHLMTIAHGYFFNAKVPVGVNPDFVVRDEKTGILRDQYGSMVKEEYIPETGETRYITYQPFIGASTRYLRDWVDSTELLLPFDQEVVADMRAETTQRVEKLLAASDTARKPNAFHILDAERAMAMARKHDDVEHVLKRPPQQAVLDFAG